MFVQKWQRLHKKNVIPNPENPAATALANSFESELSSLSNEYGPSARRFVDFKMGLKNTVYKCSDANTYAC